MAGLLVTGTDTGVGKTVVTAAIATGLRHRGFRVGVFKPVESGCEAVDGVLQPADALFLKRVSGCEAGLDLINPYAFAPPITPALAAEEAGIVIDPQHIRRCYESLAADHDFVLVEGAGGFLSPLADGFTARELAGLLRLPLLVVAANRLGTINHATLTVEAAAAAGLDVLGVVLNAVSGATDASSESNLRSLERWSGAAVLLDSPYEAFVDDNNLVALGDKLIEALEASGWPGSVQAS